MIRNQLKTLSVVMLVIFSAVTMAWSAPALQHCDESFITALQQTEKIKENFGASLNEPNVHVIKRVIDPAAVSVTAVTPDSVQTEVKSPKKYPTTKRKVFKNVVRAFAIIIAIDALFLGSSIFKYEYIDHTEIERYVQNIAHDSTAAQRLDLSQIDSLLFGLENANVETADSLRALINAINAATGEIEKLLLAEGYFEDVEGLGDLAILRDIVSTDDHKALITLLSIVEDFEEYDGAMRSSAIDILGDYTNQLVAKYSQTNTKGHLHVVAHLVRTTLERTIAADYDDPAATDVLVRAIELLNNLETQRVLPPSESFVSALRTLIRSTVTTDAGRAFMEYYYYAMIIGNDVRIDEKSMRDHWQFILPVERLRELDDKDILVAMQCARMLSYPNKMVADVTGGRYTQFFEDQEGIVASAIETMALNLNNKYSPEYQSAALDFLIGQHGKAALLEKYAGQGKSLIAQIILRVSFADDTDKTVLEDHLDKLCRGLNIATDVTTLSTILDLANELNAYDGTWGASATVRDNLKETVERFIVGRAGLTSKTVFQDRDIIKLALAYSKIFKELPAEKDAFWGNYTTDPSLYDDGMLQQCKNIEDHLYLIEFIARVFTADASRAHEKQNLIQTVISHMTTMPNLKGEDIALKMSIADQEKLRTLINSADEGFGDKVVMQINGQYINNVLNLKTMTMNDVEPAMTRAIEFLDANTGSADVDKYYGVIGNFIIGRVLSYINNNLDAFLDHFGSEKALMLAGSLKYHKFEIDQTDSDLIKVWLNIKNGNFEYLQHKLNTKYQELFGDGTAPIMGDDGVSVKEPTADDGKTIATAYEVRASADRLAKGFDLLEARDKSDGTLLSYVIKADPQKGARYMLRTDVGYKHGGITHESLQKEIGGVEGAGTLVYDFPIGFAQNNGVPLGFLAENGVVSGSVILPTTMDALVINYADGTLYLADKHDLWVHDLIPGIDKASDRKLNVTTELNDYQEFVRIIEQEKLSVVQTLLLYDQGKEIPKIHDGPNSRRLLGMTSTGSLIIIDTEKSMTTAEATDIAIAEGAVKVVYCDAGGADFASLTNAAGITKQMGTSSKGDAVNRLALFSGRLKDIGVSGSEIAENIDGVRENIWKPESEKISPTMIMIEGNIISAKIMVDNDNMPDGLSAYHFYYNKDLIIVLKEKYMEEAVYHEAREAYWMKALQKKRGLSAPDELLARDAHRLAAAEQALKYPESAYYSDQIGDRSVKELVALCLEDERAREEHHALIEEYLGSSILKKIKSFENSFREKVELAILDNTGSLDHVFYGAA